MPRILPKSGKSVNPHKNLSTNISSFINSLNWKQNKYPSRRMVYYIPTHSMKYHPTIKSKFQPWGDEHLRFLWAVCATYQRLKIELFRIIIKYNHYYNSYARFLTYLC
jgi:hypothetical protein